MRKINTLFAFCSILFLMACQKELSYELSSGNPGSADATYTLGASGTTCTGVVLAGTYTNGIAVTAGNTAKIEVDITKAGSYSISTVNVAGVGFAASGSFTSTGKQTVTLTATGKPTADGVKNFVVTAGTSTCSFDVTFDKPAPPATFTFSGSPTACTLPVINGSYAANTPVSASNTVVIKVNVTTAGSYNIVTNTVNGLSFSGSGVFASTGNDVPVTLYAAGTPLAAGTTSLKPTATASCSFDIVVKAAPVVTSVYSCKIDGVLTTFTEGAEAKLVDGFGIPELFLDGNKDASFESYFRIFITNNDKSAVKAGTYDEKHLIPTTPTSLGYRIEADYSVKNADLSTTIWNTASIFPGITDNNPPFTIVVTSITATRAKGTFSGKLTNPPTNNAFKTITEGVFDLPIQ